MNGRIWKATGWICCAALVLTSCATIIHGRSQEVPVTSEPASAKVTVFPGGQTIETPGSFILNRNTPVYTLRFEREGYETKEVELRKNLDGWVFGNLLFLGWAIIGIPVDFISGAAFRLTPTEVKELLKEQP